MILSWSCIGYLSIKKILNVIIIQYEWKVYLLYYHYHSQIFNIFCIFIYEKYYIVIFIIVLLRGYLKKYN